MHLGDPNPCGPPRSRMAASIKSTKATMKSHTEQQQQQQKTIKPSSKSDIADLHGGYFRYTNRTFTELGGTPSVGSVWGAILLRVGLFARVLQQIEEACYLGISCKRKNRKRTKQDASAIKQYGLHEPTTRDGRDEAVRAYACLLAVMCALQVGCHSYLFALVCAHQDDERL